MSDQGGKSESRPSDLATSTLSPDDCFVWGDDCEEFGIQRDRPRATAIDLFAREMGVRFEDVVCRRRYLRMLTRQESYDARAADDAEDDATWGWAESNGYVYRDGEFRDAEGNPHTPPTYDRTVPADWEPQEEDPVWEFCDKAHPGAIPCLRLESKS